MANVRVIPATAPVISAQERNTTVKRRVAFYARVSTDSSEQKTSYDAQVDYYTKFIQGHAEWEYIRGYTDEGISAVSTKRREGFKQMVADGLAGKFDLLVTKSVSRFARNTVDSLTTVRKLKEVGCEIWFEEQNIYTLDSKGELLITIMSSLAQEESRSISENVTWGQRKRMSDGKISLPYKQFLGYEKGEDDLPQIIPAEADIVRLIYRLFMEGKTFSAIARYLGAHSIPSPAGKETWQAAVVRSILTNEKYKGHALLQKKFCSDFLTKKMVKNTGQVQQYYVRTAILLLSIPTSGTLCRLRWSAERNAALSVDAVAPSRGKSYAVSAADSTVKRSGAATNPTRPTARKSTNAMRSTNTRKKAADHAERHLSRRTRSKSGFSPLSTS